MVGFNQKTKAPSAVPGNLFSGVRPRGRMQVNDVDVRAEPFISVFEQTRWNRTGLCPERCPVSPRPDMGYIKACRLKCLQDRHDIGSEPVALVLRVQFELPVLSPNRSAPQGSPNPR